MKCVQDTDGLFFGTVRTLLKLKKAKTNSKKLVQKRYVGMFSSALMSEIFHILPSLDANRESVL